MKPANPPAPISTASAAGVPPIQARVPPMMPTTKLAVAMTATQRPWVLPIHSPHDVTRQGRDPAERRRTADCSWAQALVSLHVQEQLPSAWIQAWSPVFYTARGLGTAGTGSEPSSGYRPPSTLVLMLELLFLSMPRGLDTSIVIPREGERSIEPLTCCPACSYVVTRAHARTRHWMRVNRSEEGDREYRKCTAARD